MKRGIINRFKAELLQVFGSRHTLILFLGMEFKLSNMTLWVQLSKEVYSETLKVEQLHTPSFLIISNTILLMIWVTLDKTMKEIYALAIMINKENRKP